MSEDSSSSVASSTRWPRLSWGPVAAAVVVLFGSLVIQQVAAVLIVFLPYTFGWDSIRADEWVVNSPVSSFVYILLAETMIVGSLLWFLSYKHAPFWKTVGLQRFKWQYLGYAALGFAVYYLLAAIALAAAQLLPIDVNQEQALGFHRDAGGGALVMAFVSLVILPPLVEEIMFRGFLYGTFRSSKMKVITATLITSAIFGCLHLRGSADGSLLWLAAIDTFVLSVVLCGLREKTGSIWACIGVHAFKNGAVFVNLFILGAS